MCAQLTYPVTLPVRFLNLESGVCKLLVCSEIMNDLLIGTSRTAGTVSPLLTGHEERNPNSRQAALSAALTRELGGLTAGIGPIQLIPHPFTSTDRRWRRERRQR